MGLGLPNRPAGHGRTVATIDKRGRSMQALSLKTILVGIVLLMGSVCAGPASA